MCQPSTSQCSLLPIAEERAAKRRKHCSYTNLDHDWTPVTVSPASLADGGPHAKEFKVFWRDVKVKVRLLGICKAV